VHSTIDRTKDGETAAALGRRSLGDDNSRSEDGASGGCSTENCMTRAVWWESSVLRRLHPHASAIPVGRGPLNRAAVYDIDSDARDLGARRSLSIAVPPVFRRRHELSSWPRDACPYLVVEREGTGGRDWMIATRRRRASVRFAAPRWTFDAGLKRHSRKTTAKLGAYSRP